jgi:hypothetical protein
MENKVDECYCCAFITKLNEVKADGFDSRDHFLCDVCYSTHIGLVEKYARTNFEDKVGYITKSLGYITNILIECIGRDKFNEVLKKQSEIEY